MENEEDNRNGAAPPEPDLHLSEGKSLSFLATNVAGPIALGGLPPAEAGTDASGGPEREPDATSDQGAPAPPAAEPE